MLRVEDTILLREHLVFGHYMLPTDSWIEMVYVSAVLHGIGEQLAINNVFIGVPLIGEENIAIETTIKMTPKKAQFAFEIVSTKDAHSFQKHIEGTIKPYTEPIKKNENPSFLAN